MRIAIYLEQKLNSNGQFQRYSRYIFSVFLLSSGHNKNLVDQSNKFKAYDDLGVQFYITT